LGSCIFLFVKHPYDNGDRVDIGVDQFTVEHISLLFTVFRRANGHKVGGLVQIPNISLNTLFIENLSRSGAMMEEYSVFVSFDTTFEDIQILRDELNKFVMDKDNSRDFQADMNIEILGTTDMGKLEIQVQIKHKGNWSNEVLRASRRSKFMCALVAALKAVPIYGPGGGLDAAGSAANPGYSVTITDSDAKEAAKLAAKEREQARLFPPVKDDDAASSNTASDNRAAGLTSQQARTINDLNARSPTADFARDRAFSTGRESDDGVGANLTQIRSRDTHSIDEVRGVLRRGSSRGKRRADNTHAAWAGPSIPTISEPTGDGYSDRSIPYQQAYSSAPDYSYNSNPYDVQTSYTSPQVQQTQTQARLPQVQRVGSPIEMAQLGGEAGSSNPYRTGQGYHQPPEAEDDVEEGRAAKPYSGA
jgi:hypothetical protein